MTKLSFVALSLQTTHLDPASLSKVAYVKIVDGNVTRQADMTIISPTAQQPTEAQDGLLTWEAAVEKLRMVVGRLPIVSYYRDADKEIFHAASRHLDITPPKFHWLDCREMVRQHLPDLPDTQLSTVLKALDLHDDYADATTVQQTGRIVVALGQRQHATTADQLWNDLYHQPDDPLGLDDTFDGIASIDGTADDAEDLSAREPAAAVLPITGAVPSPAIAVPDQDHLEPSQSVARPDIADLLPTFDATAVGAQPDDGATDSLDHDPLQEPAQESEDSEPTTEETVTEDVTDADDSPAAVAEDEPLSEVKDDPEEPNLFEESEPAGQDTGESARDVPDNSEITSDQFPQIPLFLQQEPRDETAEPETDAASGETPVAAPTISEDPAPEKIEEVAVSGDQQQVDAGDTAESRQDQPEVDQPDMAQDSSDLEQAEDSDGQFDVGNAQEVVADDEPEDTTPQDDGNAEPLKSNQPEYVASVALRKLPATGESTESEGTGDEIPQQRRSAVGRILGFLGMLLFGVLTLAGVALTVMAVMLFFTTNTLILETKIAGVLLTLAITLLSALMTHASYRGFRKR